MLAVILPTRGLPFSQTIDEIITELKAWGGEWQLFWSHANPVPQAYEEPTRRALADKRVTHFWYVDDDMVLPLGVLKSLMSYNVAAVACDYPANEWGTGAVMYDPDGKAFFSGAGCMLVTRELLETINGPIWRSDIGWRLRYHKDYMEFEAGADNPDKVYGRQDVTFGLRLYGRGTPIVVCPKPCGQRRIVRYGDRSTNDGAHVIKEWHKFNPQTFFVHAKQYQFAESKDLGDMVTIRMKDDSVTTSRRSHAKKLIEQGLAKRVNHAELVNWDFTKEDIK